MNYITKSLNVILTARASRYPLLSSVTKNPFTCIYKSFHIFAKPLPAMEKSFLKVKLPALNLSEGMKYKAKVRRRCEDCVLIWRQGRLYNICKTKPRHNHGTIAKPEKDTWIITFSQHKPIREW